MSDHATLDSDASGTASTPRAEKSRLAWMDCARGICILLVILVHARPAIPVFIQEQEPAALHAFNMFFDPFRMPILMFLSGMLLHKSLSKPTRPYVAGKFTQIFWPFLIFSMLILLAEGRLNIVNMLKVPISSPTLLWYLWFLVAYYMLVLAFVRLRVPLMLVAVVSLALVPVLPEFLRMPRFAYLFFFFLGGHLAMVHMARNAHGRTRLGPVPLGWATAVLGLGLAVVAGIISATQGTIKYNLAYVWAPLAMALAMLSLAPLYRSTLATEWLEWVGRNSLVFYVIHFPVQLVTVRLLQTHADVTTFMPLYVSAVIVALVVSALVQLARMRWVAVAALFDFNKVRPRPVTV